MLPAFTTAAAIVLAKTPSAPEMVPDVWLVTEPPALSSMPTPTVGFPAMVPAFTTVAAECAA